jgi:hypothetical protein
MSRKRRNHLPVTCDRVGIRVEGHAERYGFIWILGKQTGYVSYMPTI